eukprot:812813-Pelagomonas_calceolata.AAC.12
MQPPLHSGHFHSRASCELLGMPRVPEVPEVPLRGLRTILLCDFLLSHPEKQPLASRAGSASDFKSEARRPDMLVWETNLVSNPDINHLKALLPVAAWMSSAGLHAVQHVWLQQT